MKRVLSISSSRADVGILAPVWHALGDYDDIELHILLTGMHMADGAPPVKDMPDSAIVSRGGADLGGTSGLHATSAMAAIAEVTGSYIAKYSPSAVLVIGDRLDMLPAATASLPSNSPLVHLHGGEITEGAIDDRIRHALTKLSQWHCVSSKNAKSRLLAMGEAAENITVTGAPGLDTLRTAAALSRTEFFDAVGLAEGPLRLVTVHPETNSENLLAPLDAVLEALQVNPVQTLFTAPNSDPGGAEARDKVLAFCEKRDWCSYIDTLGSRLYPNALRHATVMVGNSSSGIIEAGLFGLPVINVGDRQRGRERGVNVIDVPNDKMAVATELEDVLARNVRFPPGTPYGEGHSGPKIAQVLSEVVRSGATHPSEQRGKATQHA